MASLKFNSPPSEEQKMSDSSDGARMGSLGVNNTDKNPTIESLFHVSREGLLSGTLPIQYL